MPRRKIAIDPDLLEASAKYVKKQMDVMAKHGTPVTLTTEAFDDMVYRCAVYPQECRNLQQKLDKKLTERRP